MLAVARERGVTAVVMEVSSHALVIGRVGGVRFAVGGFTNFGSDHLDFHADVERLLRRQGPLFDGRCAAGVLNLDDGAVARCSSRRHPISLLGGRRPGRRPGGPRTSTAGGYGPALHRARPGGPARRGRRAAARPAQRRQRAAGHRHAAAVAGWTRRRRAPGSPPAAGCPAGWSWSTPRPVRGVVDYAHKPDAHRGRPAPRCGELSAGRLICVIGAGGDRDRGKRPVMGGPPPAGADVVLVTDDNPRTEDPAAIRAEVLAGAAAGARRTDHRGGRPPGGHRRGGRAWPRRATWWRCSARGTRRGQEVAGEVLPFDDRVELPRRFAGGPHEDSAGATR